MDIIFLFVITVPNSMKSDLSINRVSPEEYPEDVGDDECETDESRESLGVPRPADLSVLWDVGHHAAEDHGPGGHPGGETGERHVRGRALHQLFEY